jgi:hypothetical protein
MFAATWSEMTASASLFPVFTIHAIFHWKLHLNQYFIYFSTERFGVLWEFRERHFLGPLSCFRICFVGCDYGGMTKIGWSLEVPAYGCWRRVRVQWLI